MGFSFLCDLRMFNFASGPAQLPQKVLECAQAEMLNWHGCGMSVMEMPFSGDQYREISSNALRDLTKLLSLPDNYRILFLQGGAYAHFDFVPMNLMGKKAAADYVQTGHWSTRAINEAKRYGEIGSAASSQANGFTHIPSMSEWRLNPHAAYCHVTTNETANGVQFHWIPDCGDVPLVADATSDFLARHIDVSRYGLLYASAQKNIGPAGLTIVVIRDDLLDQAMAVTPTVFNYGVQAKNHSRINTPPTYAVYIAGLVFSWLLEMGGLTTIEELNRQKAARLYAAIDADDLYECRVAVADRSWVNICFHLRDGSLEADFLDQAENRGLANLKGHDATGGIRASVYNAMPLAGVDALVAFMQEFSARQARSCSTV